MVVRALGALTISLAATAISAVAAEGRAEGRLDFSLDRWGLKNGSHPALSLGSVGPGSHPANSDRLAPGEDPYHHFEIPSRRPRVCRGSR